MKIELSDKELLLASVAMFDLYQKHGALDINNSEQLDFLFSLHKKFETNHISEELVDSVIDEYMI